MLLKTPQVGYYPEYPSTANRQMLPLWIVSSRDVELLLKRIQQNVHSGIDSRAYFVEHITDLDEVIELSPTPSLISANLRINGDYSLRTLGYTVDFEYDP